MTFNVAAFCTVDTFELLGLDAEELLIEDEKGNNLLDVAVEYENTELVSYLLSSGAFHKRAFTVGGEKEYPAIQNALDIAQSSGNEEIIGMLIEAGGSMISK